MLVFYLIYFQHLNDFDVYLQLEIEDDCIKPEPEFVSIDDNFIEKLSEERFTDDVVDKTSEPLVDNTDFLTNTYKEETVDVDGDIIPKEESGDLKNDF